MKSLTLDTSGRVVTEISEAFETYYEWGDLTPFAQGYVTALLSEFEESLTYEDCISAPDGVPPARPAGFADLAPETLARIIADCAAFPSWSGRCDHSRHAGEVFHAQRQRGQWPDTWPPLTVALDDNGKVVFT